MQHIAVNILKTSDLIIAHDLNKFKWRNKLKIFQVNIWFSLKADSLLSATNALRRQLDKSMNEAELRRAVNKTVNKLNLDLSSCKFN